MHSKGLEQMFLHLLYGAIPVDRNDVIIWDHLALEVMGVLGVVTHIFIVILAKSSPDGHDLHTAICLGHEANPKLLVQRRPSQHHLEFVGAFGRALQSLILVKLLLMCLDDLGMLLGTHLMGFLVGCQHFMLQTQCVEFYKSFAR